MRPINLFITFAFVFLALSPCVVIAEDKSWQFEVTPFFWGLAFDGSSTIGELPALDIDMGIDEMLENFNAGAAVFAIAKKNSWSMITEATYLSLEETTHTAGIGLKQNLDTYLFMAAAGYRLPTEVALDVYGGARFMRMDVGVERNGTEKRNGDKDWIDPLIGLRLSLPLAKSITFHLNGDIGGFGVGSDFTYMIMPVLTYQFNGFIAGKMAYRWLDVDYDKDDFSMNMLISGPMLGLTFTW